MKSKEQSTSLPSFEDISVNEIAAKGYDLRVIDFFEEQDPEMLRQMWGSDNFHYDKIMKNIVTSEELAETLLVVADQFEDSSELDGIFRSSMVLAAFRLKHQFQVEKTD